MLQSTALHPGMCGKYKFNLIILFLRDMKFEKRQIRVELGGTGGKYDPYMLHEILKGYNAERFSSV